MIFNKSKKRCKKTKITVLINTVQIIINRQINLFMITYRENKADLLTLKGGE